MKNIYLLFLPIFMLLTNNAFGKISKNDTSLIYNEIKGDYAIYIKKHSMEVPFNIVINNNILWFRKTGNKNDIELNPIDIDNLKFKMIDADSRDYLNFYRDKNGEISSFDLVSGKKKYSGNKLNIKQDSISIADKIFTVDILKNELTQVKDFLVKNHPAPYKFTNKKEFYKLFNEQLAKINHPMGVREFYVIAAPLVEAINCGHTYLELANSFWTKENKRSFPIELIFIDGKAYVQSFFKEDISIPIGSEIKSINNIKMDDIVHSAKQIISSDGENETWKFHWISRDFAQYFTILYGPFDLYNVEYIEPNTKNIYSTTLTCIQSSQLVKSSSGKSNLDFEVDKSNNLAVITIKDNNYYENIEIFTTFIDSCFKRISNDSIGNLLLDIRDNTGGDPFSSSYLLSYLEKMPVPYLKNNSGIKQFNHLAKPIPMAKNNSFRGNLFILINGGCFSSTGHLCSILKYHHLGTFIGEETGGTYECNDAHYAHQTKETHLDVNVAHITYATAVKGMSREHNILPDYTVKPKIDNIIHGKDTVKDFAYNLIKKSDIKKIE